MNYDRSDIYALAPDSTQRFEDSLVKTLADLADLEFPPLYDLGFHPFHPLELQSNDIFDFGQQQWARKLALMGNIPTALLAYGSEKGVLSRDLLRSRG